jgi:hypothetical protein
VLAVGHYDPSQWTDYVRGDVSEAARIFMGDHLATGCLLCLGSLMAARWEHSAPLFAAPPVRVQPEAPAERRPALRMVLGRRGREVESAPEAAAGATRRVRLGLVR